ncbi:MAG: hypothetical protein LBI41_01120 [Lactobacillales bacterium]|jgi:hypothetical protein|nr:hypothetical protein [Lactobacillales bacterium]
MTKKLLKIICVLITTIIICTSTETIFATKEDHNKSSSSSSEEEINDDLPSSADYFNPDSANSIEQKVKEFLEKVQSTPDLPHSDPINPVPFTEPDFYEPEFQDREACYTISLDFWISEFEQLKQIFPNESLDACKIWNLWTASFMCGHIDNPKAQLVARQAFLLLASLPEFEYKDCFSMRLLF